MWWHVWMWPFADFGAPNKRQHLGYYYGTEKGATRAAEGMSGYDSWGSVVVERVYLEDIDDAIVIAHAEMLEAQSREAQLTEIKQSIMDKMGVTDARR